jgi:stalled ribosome alternative rescue factor ArfA
MVHPQAEAETMAALALLVAALLEDPAVRQRVEQDPRLRAAVNDPAVQGHIAASTAREAGMAGLYEIVSNLLSDPAVQARVQADPVLQALWADPAVRQHIEQRGRR